MSGMRPHSACLLGTQVSSTGSARGQGRGSRSAGKQAWHMHKAAASTHSVRPHLISLFCLCSVQVRNVPMPTGVTHVSISARKPFVAVVSLRTGPPVVVDLSTEQPTVTSLDGINLKGGRSTLMP